MGIAKCKTCEYHCDRCDEILKDEMTHRHTTNHSVEDTLCWCCKKIIPTKECSCSWSKSAKPVEGWEAECTRIIDGHWHYKVISCPEFVRGR